MSVGFGVPKMDWSVLADIGESYRKVVREYEQREYAKKIGGALKAGDYDGAASLAFDSGEANTGLSLLKLGEAARQTRLGEAASADLMRSLSGGYGGSDAMSPLGQRGDRSVPSFADQGAPSAGYVSSLFKRESNNNPNARASTSSATGLGQFVTKTWNQLASQRPDLQLTPVGNGQDGRTDPQQMTRATEAFTADNGEMLRRSGLPVNDATLYSAHLLGLGGARRFVAGTMANPDRPAVNLVSPEQAAANRNVFFHRDGRAKTAGEVMGDFERSFSGGRPVAPRPAAAPAFAANESETRALERSMGMLPRDVAAYDPRADMPAPGAVPAIGRTQGVNPDMPPPSRGQAPAPGFGAPPLSGGSFQRRAPDPGEAPSMTTGSLPSVAGSGASIQPAPTALQHPPSINSDRAHGSTVPGPTPMFSPAAPVPAVPTLGGPAPDRVMTMPGEAPVQVAQVGGAADPREAAATRMVQGIGAADMGNSQKIQALTRAVANPYLPDAPRQLAQTMLREELERSRLPDGVKEFMWARANGLTQARTPAEHAREGKGPTTLAPGSSILSPDGRSIVLTAPGRERENKVSGDIEAREEAAQRLGLSPGSPAYQSFVLTGKMPREDQQPLSASDKKAILEADDGVASAETAISNLTQAKTISKKAYEGPAAGPRGAFTGYFGSEEGLATTDLDNLVTTNALGQLKSIFGGNPTEGERKILLDIQGSSSLPHAARVVIYDRAIDLANRRLDLNRQRAAELRGQTYYRPGGGSPETRGQGQQLTAAPPAAAVEALRSDPSLRSQFDAKYGPGSAAGVLGGP